MVLAQVALRHRLDPFGQHLEPHRVGHADGGGDDRRVVRIVSMSTTKPRSILMRSIANSFR
jgi:hypothetical protein